MIKVDTFWDNEAKVWVAESDQVPGLVAEAASIPELEMKLATLIPEMLEANSDLVSSGCEIHGFSVTGNFSVEGELRQA